MKEQSTHKMYYIAIVCPPVIDKEILKYKHWMRERFGCTVALKSAAHITLVAPFWLEETKETALKVTLQNLKTTVTPFQVTLNNFSHFSKKVLFVHVEANERLSLLQAQTKEYFTQYFNKEIKPDNRAFHPHVTFANRDLSPSAFDKAWDRFSKEDFTASFTVDKISLLKLSPGKWNTIDEKYF